MVDLGEHVVQAVTEFMEQGDDFIMSQQSGIIAGWRGKVAGQVSDRGLNGVSRFFCGLRNHPSRRRHVFWDGHKDRYKTGRAVGRASSCI